MHGRLLVLYPAYLHVVGFFARVKFNVYYFVYEEFKLIKFKKWLIMDKITFYWFFKIFYLLTFSLGVQRFRFLFNNSENMNFLVIYKLSLYFWNLSCKFCIFKQIGVDLRRGDSTLKVASRVVDMSHCETGKHERCAAPALGNNDIFLNSTTKTFQLYLHYHTRWSLIHTHFIDIQYIRGK